MTATKEELEDARKEGLSNGRLGGLFDGAKVGREAALREVLELIETDAAKMDNPFPGYSGRVCDYDDLTAKVKAMLEKN